jgi:hypothetical protein
LPASTRPAGAVDRAERHGRLAARGEEGDEHRERVAQPAQHLDQPRIGRDAEHAGDEGAHHRRRRHPGGRVEDLPLADQHPAGLVRGPQGARHQPGGDEHEEDAGDAEEPAEVDADTAGVDGDAHADSAQDAGDGSGQGEHAASARRLHGREQEHRGLESLLEDREEGHRGEGERAAGAHGRRASRSSSPLSRKACRFIQMIIVVTKNTATAPMTVSSISW